MYCTNRDCPDFAATGMHGEYREGVTECPYCNQALVASLPDRVDPIAPDPPAEKPPQTWGDYEAPEKDGAHDDLEPVYETADPTEIPVVRSFLDAHGVPHVVVGEERFDAFRGSLSPFRFNPKAGVVAFLVPSPYAEIARDLLTEIEETTQDRD